MKVSETWLSPCLERTRLSPWERGRGPGLQSDEGVWDRLVECLAAEDSGENVLPTKCTGRSPLHSNASPLVA